YTAPQGQGETRSLWSRESQRRPRAVARRQDGRCRQPLLPRPPLLQTLGGSYGPLFSWFTVLSRLLRAAPRHAAGKVFLKFRTPTTHGGARIKFIPRRQITPPAISLALILAAPSGPRWVTGIMA